jgi:hypothetical protein
MPRKKPVKGLRETHPIEVGGESASVVRQKLRDGLAKLEEANKAKDAESARQRIAEGWPTSVETFLRWVGVGNDRLYTDHVDLKSDISDALAAFKAMSKITEKPTRRTNELRSARERVAYLERIAEGLAKDVLDLATERDKFKRDYAVERSRAILYEAELRKHGIPIPRPETHFDVSPLPAKPSWRGTRGDRLQD